MNTNQSTHQKFETAKNQVIATILVVALLAYTLVAIKTCFIDTATLQRVYSQGVNDAIKNNQ